VGWIKKKAKVQAAPKARGGRAGRSLMPYFLPAVLVAIVLMAAVVLFAQQSIRGAAQESAQATAHTVATAVAARLEGAIIARRDLLALALSDGRAAAALGSGDPKAMRAVEADLQQKLTDVIQVRLLPRDANQPDTSGPAPLGYAGLDMLRRAVQSDQPAAEVHQVKSDLPYLALALPVSDAGQNVGVLFMAWDLRFLVRLVEDSPPFPGRLQLIQGGGTGYALAKGPGQFEGMLDDGSVDVPESIWKVTYGVDPHSGGLGDLTTMGMLVAGGALALALSVFLQLRMLGRDLREDMRTVVHLGEAVLRREGAATPSANLAGTSDAIALLGQYAREARESPVGSKQADRPPTPVAVADERSRGGVEVEELDSDPAELLAGSLASNRAPVDIAESLFRAYDLRGVVGETLTAPVAELLGRAVATLVREQGGQRIAVARDARLSSPELAASLTNGLVAAGCDVLDIGPVPTPLLYFAMHTQPVQAAIMVTGSHNPASYNGFKIVIGDRVLDGEDLLSLRQRMLDGAFSQGQGKVEQGDMLDAYLEAMAQEVQLARPLKVVVDAGNGVAGETAIASFEALGCEVVPLFCEPDGSFPNHHPDPSDPENLASLMLEVQAQEADLGVALDGDGDRLGLVDNTGTNIWPDSVLMLLAADVLGRHPGVDILYDVKSSRHLASFILAHGGRPIMWKSGHSRMRAKMLETGALLGGEFSGHLFIKERWFGFDDAIYAAARVLEIMALEPRTANELFAELPSSPSTPEYQLILEEGQSRDLMRALDAHKVFDDARLVELDGLRVEFANGWGLIRPSNTTPSLIFRFEADDEGALEEIKARFRDLLRRVAPDMQAPF
jgi:phosphomannomutase/phosphoglucomutase